MTRIPSLASPRSQLARDQGSLMMTSSWGLGIEEMLARFTRSGQDTEAGAGLGDGGRQGGAQWAVVLPHCLVVPGERPGRSGAGHPPGNCLIYSEIFHCPRHVILTTYHPGQRGLNKFRSTVP